MKRMEIFIYSYSQNTFNQNLKSKLKKLVTNKRLRDLENFIANKRLIELNRKQKTYEHNRKLQDHGKHGKPLRNSRILQ